MKITAYNGSPDSRKSVTNKMVQEILAGAIEAGEETQNFFLAEKNINHCRACSHCLSVKLNKCSKEWPEIFIRR